MEFDCDMCQNIEKRPQTYMELIFHADYFSKNTLQIICREKVNKNEPHF